MRPRASHLPSLQELERAVRPGRARTEKACAIIDDLIEPVVPVVQGQVATSGDYPLRCARMASGFRGIFSETQAGQLKIRSSSSSRLDPIVMAKGNADLKQVEQTADERRSTRQ